MPEATVDASRENAAGQKADIIRTRFIEPGLVHYADVGTVFVRKETLDKFAQSFVGRPIFNEQHKDTTSRDFSAGHADGVITRVWYEPTDGWYWAEGAVWDGDTKVNCRNGYSVSCAYDVTRWSERGGVHNNLPYSREVLDGEYTHMAIVANPRYEGARILYNTQGGSMKLAFWRKDENKADVKNASEVEADKTTVTIDGQEVPLPKLIELFNATKTKDAPAPVTLADDDEFEIGGAKVTLADLKNSYLASIRNKGDDEDEEKKKKAEEERKNAEDEEKRKKEEEDKEKERKNAEDRERKEREETERRNAQASRDRLRNAANDRNGRFEPPALMTREERINEGAARYGAR